MAVPVYVPEGIGPVSVDSNNNNVNNIRRNYSNNSTVQNTVNLPQSPSTLVSFTHNLIVELYTLYSAHMMGNQLENEISSAPAEDNQSGGRRNLPDIIQCHNGVSLDLTLDSRIRNSPSYHRPDENEEDWTIELKVQVGGQVGSPWRQAGIELRMIADRFQQENARQRSRTNSLKCRLLVSFPATAAIAVLGIGIASIAWLRRH